MNSAKASSAERTRLEGLRDSAKHSASLWRDALTKVAASTVKEPTPGHRARTVSGISELVAGYDNRAAEIQAFLDANTNTAQESRVQLESP